MKKIKIPLKLFLEFIKCMGKYSIQDGFVEFEDDTPIREIGKLPENLSEFVIENGVFTYKNKKTSEFESVVLCETECKLLNRLLLTKEKVSQNELRKCIFGESQNTDDPIRQITNLVYRLNRKLEKTCHCVASEKGYMYFI